jgi:hypothetical protein
MLYIILLICLGILFSINITNESALCDWTAVVLPSCHAPNVRLTQNAGIAAVYPNKKERKQSEQ